MTVKKLYVVGFRSNGLRNRTDGGNTWYSGYHE